MKPGQIRIIGGEWRSRKIEVPDLPHLRPTPDRVRESLFNWLAPVIAGARCLDAFAGTGILGLEALSRGAGHVTWIDESFAAMEALRYQLHRLQVPSDKTDIRVGHLPGVLSGKGPPWDIVFLDPPYQSGALLPTCFVLEDDQWLSHQAFIYFESDAVLAPQDLPKHWELAKAKKAGKVRYYLAHRQV